MHHAKLDKSHRLQRVLAVLSDGLPHTSRDLIRRAHTVAPATTVSELRHQGKHINCRRVGNRWWYQMEVV